MTEATDTLAAKVEQVEEKASDYETATNFEAKKQEYANGLSSIESSIGRLQRRLERMEFLATILVDVLDETRDSVPGAVAEARQSARSVVDHDEDFYYELVDEGRTDQYEQKLQQARSNVQSAIDTLEAELTEVERDWKQRVNAARNILKLFGRSREMNKTLNQIENFVDHRMVDDSESTTTLDSEWQGLRKNWERSGVDWNTFQKENDLSDKTIDVLEDLAKGENVSFDQLDETIAAELLSVDELQDVVKLTI